jgi:hypothetical protein
MEGYYNRLGEAPSALGYEVSNEATMALHTGLVHFTIDIFTSLAAGLSLDA